MRKGRPSDACCRPCTETRCFPLGNKHAQIKKKKEGGEKRERERERERENRNREQENTTPGVNTNKKFEQGNKILANLGTTKHPVEDENSKRPVQT